MIRSQRLPQSLTPPPRPPSVAGEMVRQARILAQATSDLVNAIKMDAEGESDLENSRKLLSAAKLLADATAKMVEAAKVPLASHDGPAPLSCTLKLPVLADREQRPIPTARSSSRSSGRRPRGSGSPPTLPPRTLSRSAWSASWRCEQRLLPHLWMGGGEGSQGSMFSTLCSCVRLRNGCFEAERVALCLRKGGGGPRMEPWGTPEALTLL